MERTCNTGIKSRGFMLSNEALLYSYFIFVVAMWALLLLGIPIVHIFPELMFIEWLLGIPIILIFIIFLLYILSYFCSVVLEPNVVVLKWFGIPVRRIPVSRFKMLCAVGNGGEDSLCLSSYSVEEMAQMQEQRQLRSFLNKHDVPFRKRRANWQDDFAREYIIHLRRSTFRMLRERDMIMMEMHPALQYALREMYPQLPYRNFTEVKSQHIPRYSTFNENKAVLFPFEVYDVLMESDGIHLSSKKKEITFIPGQQIRTVVRVDIFRSYEKYSDHHTPLLFVTCMSEEELAALPSARGYGGFRLDDSAEQPLLAMTAASFLTLRWSRKIKNCCVLYCSEKNLNDLHSLYPHAKFNEAAASWLASSSQEAQ